MGRRVRSASTIEDKIVAGRYQIEASLGRGGMGEVFLAFDVHLRRQVALKVPTAPGPFGSEDLRRFRREARAAAVLSHPNIVAVYDIVLDGGRPYIVMELVPGWPLSATIGGGRTIEPVRAAAIACDVADALAYAHARGVVHRDVKPANVMLTPWGQPKVLDFGIARYRAATPSAGSDRRFGTPEYLAPEQIRGEPADGRADIYALGCVLSEMLTGRPPFTGEAVAVAYQHLENEPPVPSASNRAVPAEMDRIVLRCLQKDPAARYQTAGALVEDLRRARGGVAMRSAPTAVRAEVSPTVPVPRRTERATAVLPDVRPRPAGASPPARRPRATRRVRRRWPLIAGAAMAAAAILWVALWFAPAGTVAIEPTVRPSPPPLVAPAAVLAKGSCDGFLRFRVTVSWAPSSSSAVTGYVLSRAVGTAGAFRQIERLQGRTATTFVDHDRGASTVYRYVVRPIAGSRIGPPSRPATATTPFFCMS